MNAPLQTSPASHPADACAKKLLAEHELKSPAFRAAIAGLPREIVLLLMAMAFVEGTLHGAKQLAEGIKGAA